MKFSLSRLLLTLASVIFLPTVLAATTASNLNLNEVVTVAMERSAPADNTVAPFSSSSWLAALPSVNLSYLASDEREGTDETELSLNLPIKSAGGRRHDKIIAETSTQAEDTSKQRRRLFYSGLVREALWSLKLSTALEELTLRKLNLLQELEVRQQELLAAEAASLYGLLAIRQEKLQAQIEQVEQRRETARWQQRYRQVTGLGNVPIGIDEPEPPAQFSPAQHPDMQLLTLDWQRRKSLLSAASEHSSPWYLSVTAKQLDNPQFDENQYGVAIEIPMSFLDLDSEANRGEWREAAQQYWQAHDELQAQLKDNWQQLANEGQFLREKQTLLDEAAATGKQLIGQLEQLRISNELGAEVLLRRTMEAVDTQAATETNLILIGQNRAMLRQAAGIPL